MSFRNFQHSLLRANRSSLAFAKCSSQSSQFSSFFFLGGGSVSSPPLSLDSEALLAALEFAFLGVLIFFLAPLPSFSSSSAATVLVASSFASTSCVKFSICFNCDAICVD